VVSAEELDDKDMVCDFKALKMALKGYIERLDHAMAVNSRDPLLEAMQGIHPGGVVVFEERDPTTEVIAHDIYDYAASVLRAGYESESYRIDPGHVRLEKVRVWETPNSWAEYGE
jgi:6-pyruvoyltetrahydropterin/6-carboxytetrahydropterin synthase